MDYPLVELRGLEPLTPTLPGVGTLPEQARCRDAGRVVDVAGAGAVVSVVVKSVVSAPPRCPRRPEGPGAGQVRVSTAYIRVSTAYLALLPAPRSTGRRPASSAAGGFAQKSSSSPTSPGSNGSSSSSPTSPASIDSSSSSSPTPPPSSGSSSSSSP